MNGVSTRCLQTGYFTNQEELFGCGRTFTETNSIEQSPLEKLIFTQWRSVTVFTRVCCRNLTWTTEIETISCHIYLRSILKLSSHVLLGLPSALFPLGFLNKMYVFLTSVYGTCSIHPILLDWSPYNCLPYLMKSTNYEASHYVTSFSCYLSLFGPIISSAPCSQTPFICAVLLDLGNYVHPLYAKNISLNK
jgi:hypothetical protein